MGERQQLVVEAEQVQDRGVQIGRRGAVDEGAVAEVVGRSVGLPPLIPPPASQMLKP